MMEFMVRKLSVLFADSDKDLNDQRWKCQTCFFQECQNKHDDALAKQRVWSPESMLLFLNVSQ